MNLQEAYKLVIKHIDEEMEESPTRVLADLSNTLEDRLKELSDE